VIYKLLNLLHWLSLTQVGVFCYQVDGRNLLSVYIDGLRRGRVQRRRTQCVSDYQPMMFAVLLSLFFHFVVEFD